MSRRYQARANLVEAIARRRRPDPQLIGDPLQGRMSMRSWWDPRIGGARETPELRIILAERPG